MRTVRISDAELQKLIATELRKRLVAGGFAPGARSDVNCFAFFPINLDLAGSATVQRDEDGFWTFTQEVDEIAEDRTAEAHGAHASAVAAVRGSVEA